MTIELQEGKTYANWTIIQLLGGGYSICQCKCGNIQKVPDQKLKYSRAKRCQYCPALHRKPFQKETRHDNRSQEPENQHETTLPSMSTLNDEQGGNSISRAKGEQSIPRYSQGSMPEVQATDDSTQH